LFAATIIQENAKSNNCKLRLIKRVAIFTQSKEFQQGTFHQRPSDSIMVFYWFCSSFYILSIDIHEAKGTSFSHWHENLVNWEVL
jgi:hypothetical protein